LHTNSEMGSGQSRKKTNRWCDAYKNDFYLTSGEVRIDCITFRVKRTNRAPALSFSIGERLFITHRQITYTAEVSSFLPHSRCGSVIAASGLISLVPQEDIASAVASSNRSEHDSTRLIFYDT